MLVSIVPKLPMRDKAATRWYYVDGLGFSVTGDHPDYLMLARDGVEIHFFAHPDLDPATNDGQVYVRTRRVEALYRDLIQAGVPIHPNGPLGPRPWGQTEFSLLDPDRNLLTFGEES